MILATGMLPTQIYFHQTFLIVESAVLNCIRVLAGYTHAETVFNTENFIESEFLKHEISGNVSTSRNWYEISYLLLL